ncbi:MAG TPA: hypothetical protein VL025_13415, partial [Thermoanaerobaculia bacterium]|nr:hypothetical protein [Thermoanaerobaculia bacterium]
MRCHEIAPCLEDLLDEELEAASPVHEHLAACPECRRRLEWLAASREAFRTLPPERPRNGFDRRLAERIAVETGAKALPTRGEVWRRPGLQWALAA